MMSSRGFGFRALGSELSKGSAFRVSGSGFEFRLRWFKCCLGEVLQSL